MTLYQRSHSALEDWQQIVEYTLGKHSEDQAQKYMSGLIKCIEAMAQNKGYFRDTQIKGRVVRIKRCQKHYIFGLVRENKPLMVIALFHERMDLMSRLKRRL